ncbi:MAG TPA: phosphonate ABC transporter substrate-binding protein [Rhizobiales bacterium]|nr:phosphonate ABC transporter substrate-binding protein [Hyphomicrobiales bacterium]
MDKKNLKNTILQVNRRQALAGGLRAAGALAALPVVSSVLASQPFRLGITPVFLDNDAAVIDALRSGLQDALGVPVRMEQRRAYKEVTGMLLDGELDAAWLCGYPYLQHKDELEVVAVPLWHGKPLYRSYLIVSTDDTAKALDDLEGDVHAFSDPDSNSGFLVTASDLARKGKTVRDFFRRTIFTYGHRNVVRAVAAGLVRSGSVDGYVWEALATMEPAITSRTKVIYKSEWLGFPPVCIRKDNSGKPALRAFRKAVLKFDTFPAGHEALRLLQLDGMAPAPAGLFAGIEKRMQDYARMS